MSPDTIDHSEARHGGTDGKLVRMANQIATFFRSQPSEDGPAGIATHINKFWEPRMRGAFLALAQAGGAGFDPLVIEAVPLIKRPASGAPAIGTGDDAAAGASRAREQRGKGTAAGESLSEPSIPE